MGIYKFSAWKVLAIGPDNIADSWRQLVELASKAQTITAPSLENIDNQVVIDSLDKLSDIIGNCHESLLPTFTGDMLRITEGFLFFDDVYEPEEISSVPQADVLLTIASVLQTAREHKDPEYCLRPTNYQSVIIAPETFLRFNDEILQACLLRACLPSELDYSSDANMSEIMAEFVLKVFIRHEHSFGYSALEFAAALVTGKLKLKKEHGKELFEKAVPHLSNESSALLGFLLMGNES